MLECAIAGLLVHVTPNLGQLLLSFIDCVIYTVQVDGAVRWALWEAAMQLEEHPLCRPEYGGVAVIIR